MKFDLIRSDDMSYAVQKRIEPKTIPSGKLT